MTPEYLAEVVESSTTVFTAQCWELHNSPPLGSLVRVDSDPPVFGVVSDVATRSIEPGRRPIAYGIPEEQLREEQPQIFELLRTEFEAVIVGYEDSPYIRQFLPPHPPRIHSFVRPCSKDEVRTFTGQWDFLRMLLSAPRVPTDELIIAAVRSAFEAWDRDRNYLVRAGKELSRLLKNDYERLGSLMRRISQ